MTKPRQKSNLWQFDPSLFQPLPKASILERRLLAPARTLGKHALYAAALAWPVAIVILGIIFGGLVFWTSFAGSIGLIWLIITKTGYARNFADWDVGYRKFLGLLLAFGLMLGLVYGLTHLRIWVLPIPVVALAVLFLLGVWKQSRS